VASWIASRSLSSGAHSRDPLARNDGPGCLKIESALSLIRFALRQAAVAFLSYEFRAPIPLASFRKRAQHIDARSIRRRKDQFGHTGTFS
jgi:hypothetical protein